MNPDREPLSPPTSPPPEEEEGMYAGEVSDSCEDTYTPVDGSDDKDDSSESSVENDNDDDDRNVPSSPPTSVETMSKSDQRIVSGEISHEDSAGYRAPAVETEDEDEQDENRREYFQYDTGNDTFHRKNWENSSQWEDEDGEPSRSRLSSPPLARVQSQTSSRKSPAPSSPLFPPRPRQTTNSAKSNLSHQFSTRRSPASRASSESYDHREREHRDEKKPPLVLLHVTLLLLPGAEEVVLRHLTPTTIERGVLVEHPRGDYNLLEELILDGLGLDEDFVEDTTEPEEPLEKTWEQALNILPTAPPKKAWQLRVYASNGLMTPGAWKRVWAEMERIDVEIWPRGFDRKRAGIRGFGFAGGHSRGTSSSALSAILPDEGCETDDLLDDDGRRKSYSGSSGIMRRRGSSANGEMVQHRLASSAPVPTSPVRARTPTQKSRRGRSRGVETTGVGFDVGRFLTPRAIMVGAGVNLLLFLYFTVFRFVGVGWTSSLSVASLFGGETQAEVWKKCEVGGGDEICGEMYAEGEVEVEEQVDGEKVVDELEELEELEELDTEVVEDPEIGDADADADVDEVPVESEGSELDEPAFQLDYGVNDPLSDQDTVDADAGVDVDINVDEAEAETNPEDMPVEGVIEGEDADTETQEEIQVEEEQKSKYSFLGFGFSS